MGSGIAGYVYWGSPRIDDSAGAGVWGEGDGADSWGVDAGFVISFFFFFFCPPILFFWIPCFSFGGTRVGDVVGVRVERERGRDEYFLLMDFPGFSF